MLCITLWEVRRRMGQLALGSAFLGSPQSRLHSAFTDHPMRHALAMMPDATWRWANTRPDGILLGGFSDKAGNLVIVLQFMGNPGLLVHCHGDSGFIWKHATEVFIICWQFWRGPRASGVYNF